MTFFEKVEVPRASGEFLLALAWNRSRPLERKYAITFSFGALKMLSSSADRYFGDLAEDKTLDILSELASNASRGTRLVTEEMVSASLQSITGVPQGVITKSEGENLISLESNLHKRVVGQNEAIKAIATALRRSRTGVANSSRPIGSFLFLGPTGVGKTETAKALAEIFFKGESNLIRLDMSEYNTSDALSRLIGAAGRPGALASWAREKPYGVLLLDEFEKTHKDVQDLFLQILDEGYFTDGSSIKVNLRSMIIIVTSNAGSPLIYEWAKKGEKLAGKKEELIRNIVNEGTFKPELINRFDTVVMYQPLTEKELRTVAETMLLKLSSRLKEKGIGITVTDDLITFLVKYGNDPVFGARAMNRLIQNTVEAKISDKILRGQIERGEMVRLDIGELEQSVVA
jgi:ATP-dependent Clp protease ATP-binding subunit ClpA